MRTLLVEHDQDAALVLQREFNKTGFRTCCVGSGEDAIAYGQTYPYDVILLELSLPDMSGQDVIRTLKYRRVHTPILAIAEGISEESMLRTLRLGAAFLPLPAYGMEVVAVAHALIRRANGLATSEIEIGSLRISLIDKQASVRGEPLALSPTQWEILAKLSLRKSEWVSHDELFDYLYGGDLEVPGSRSLDTLVSRLRKRLAAFAPNDFALYSKYGVGYRLA